MTRLLVKRVLLIAQLLDALVGHQFLDMKQHLPLPFVYEYLLNTVKIYNRQ